MDQPENEEPTATTPATPPAHALPGTTAAGAPTVSYWQPSDPQPPWPPTAPVPLVVPSPAPLVRGGAPWGPTAWSWRRWLAVAAVAAVIGGGSGAAVTEGLGGGSNGTTPAATSTPPGPALAGGASIPAIVAKVLPEVVSIDAKGPGGGFFGGGVSEAQGTGMIISTTGEVLTNDHVIAGATVITVTLYGQTAALPATLVGADPSNDMALLKVRSPPANLRAVAFGDSKQLQVGDAVIAVGNALGLSAGTPTVTSGIVSALGRTVQTSDTGTGAAQSLTNMIQTDAAINSGNSGGPLVDSSGQVIGMNTAVAASSTGNAPAQNIGFAIPSATIGGLLGGLRSGGTRGASAAYLGVEVADETPALQQAYGFVPSSGAVVVAVLPASPAAAAGLEQGDVVVSFGSRAISSAQDLTNATRQARVGQVVALGVYRGAQRLSLRVTLGTAPAS